MRRLLRLLLTLLTLVFVVSLDVLGQVVRSHESALTDRADELLLAGMGPFVAGQLIGSGKPTAAVRPLADEWPLACVDPLVGFQVTGLEVVLATVRVFALVDSSALRLRRDRQDGGGGGGSGVDRLRN